jgi:glycosyltransferase involved in cell wall biosynthesis
MNFPPMIITGSLSSIINSSTSVPKIVLLTMIKNETRIIQRLLESVRGKVDAAVICDTGSTDDTVEKANNWLKANGMPGEVFHFPFKNFGASRTQSYLSCQEWVQKQEGWDPANTWALLLDGDMMLSDPVDRVALQRIGTDQAGITLKQSAGSLIYGNVRLLRCSEGWVCKGGTHEAWTCPPNKHTTIFDKPVLIDHGDGGCKSDKYERDVRLLLEDLQEMPNDARTHFYLGQTYLCMRNYTEAIKTLKRRIEIGGWDEELYITRLYLGECYENTGQDALMIQMLMEAWQFRQFRTEAPMRLLTYYRKQPKSQFLAMLIFEKMYEIFTGENFVTGEKFKTPANNTDVLFVNKRNTDFSMWEELAIIGFYTDRMKQTWMRIDELDMRNTLNWHEYNSIFGNLHWYDWVLKPRRQARFQIPLERLPWANEEFGECWQPYNPSIRVKPDRSGYIVNLRCANYYTAEAKFYHYRAFHGKVLTRNCLMDVPATETWNQPTSLEEILIDPKFPQREHYIRGVEDCRLIQGTDAMEYMGTSQSYSSNGTNKIFHVWRDEGESAWSLRQLPLPPGVNPNDTQKNWLGFRQNGELRYIYNFSPYVVCDGSGNIVVQVDTTRGQIKLREYRGSAGPVAWSSSKVPDEAYLCVAHKVYIGDEGRRYYHRFITLDKDLRPSRVSCFVRMTKERVEYWSGMCPSIRGDSMWITYGTKDSEGYIAELPLEEIESLMMYNMKTGTATDTRERLQVIRKY